MDGANYEDDGGLSSDEGETEDEAEFVDASDSTPPSSGSPKHLTDIYIPPPDLSMPGSSTDSSISDLTKPGIHQTESPKPFNLPELNILPSSPATPTPGNLPTPMPNFGATEDTPKASTAFSLPTTPGSSRFIPKKFVRKFSGLTGGSSGSSQPSSPAVDIQGNLVPPESTKKRSSSAERKKFGRSWSSGSGSGNGTASPSGSGSGSDSGAISRPAIPALSTGGKRKKSDFEFKGTNDILGIVMLEIQSADDLPRLANSTY